MFTGYFAKLDTYKDNGLIPVSICSKAPDWYDGLQFKKLAPKWNFLKEWKYGLEHKGDNQYYIEHFQSDVLSSIEAKSVIKELTELTNAPEDKIILICYEKPDSFCHRHLVANWLSSEIKCNEWSFKE